MNNKEQSRNINDYKYPIHVIVFFKTDEKDCRISREFVQDCLAVGIELSIGDEYIKGYTPCNFMANSLDDIVKYYEKNKDKKMRFSDNLLNEHFGIKVE
jgi:hypothetical protein